MNYVTAYCQATGRVAPVAAERLTPLFDKIAADVALPPRGQQAVDAGFTAHTLVDARENPAIYRYYQWVLTHVLAAHPVKELTAQLIGTGFVSANLFETALPQPVTLNAWQIPHMLDFPLSTRRAVILENNGVFIWLHHRHPTWPLIAQIGNDFNVGANQMLTRLIKRGLVVTYLGDLDSVGLQIADRVAQLVPSTPSLFALQTPDRVSDWLVRFGRPSDRRTVRVDLTDPVLQREAVSVHAFGKFVEQESLIADYEALIARWLAIPERPSA